METTTSADGTTLAFDRLGDGPSVILIPGATCTRGVTTPLAELLAASCTVLNVDRRGRGDSDDRSGSPYAAERETEDLAALIQAAGGHAALYGHSSGAAVVLRAAAAGLPVDRLVLHDAPYSLESTDESRAYWAEINRYLDDRQPGEAVAAFLRQVGMPDQMITGMRSGPQWPAMEAVGYTLAYDSAAMDDINGGAVPRDLLGAVRVPTMVLVGSDSFPFMIESGQALQAGIDGARFDLLEGGDHAAGAELVAPALLPFLTGSPSSGTPVPAGT